jgi:hypothetical protein
MTDNSNPNSSQPNSLTTDNGSTLSWGPRSDGKGTQWTVKDASGKVTESARDKTDYNAPKGKQHHRVDQLKGKKEEGRKSGW